MFSSPNGILHSFWAKKYSRWQILGGWCNEIGVRKQNNDSWHLVFIYIKNWKAYKSLIFCYKDSIAYHILSIRPENVRKMPFMHGYSCYYLTIKLQTYAWLACKFFVNNYFLVRPLSDVRNTPVSLSTEGFWCPKIVKSSVGHSTWQVYVCMKE